ncbi:unnamed protein product [Calicophoron daubneyi]|uniref:CCHC-type domain-containing protein n=1 Tax=Calicophoron daubneyi TaxID=300641 RepID=A0AAV2TFF5_CALDB
MILITNLCIVVKIVRGSLGAVFLKNSHLGRVMVCYHDTSKSRSGWIRATTRDVLRWFDESPYPSRIEFVCGLLQLCTPSELRFYGSCLEEIARLHYDELREIDLQSNSVSDFNGGNCLSAFFKPSNGSPDGDRPSCVNLLKLSGSKFRQNTLPPSFYTLASNPTLRSQLILRLSLLKSTNVVSANAYFEALMADDTPHLRGIFRLSPFASFPSCPSNMNANASSDESEDESRRPSSLTTLELKAFDEILLIYTLAAFHPAFTFDQRQRLYPRLLTLHMWSDFYRCGPKSFHPPNCQPPLVNPLRHLPTCSSYEPNSSNLDTISNTSEASFSKSNRDFPLCSAACPYYGWPLEDIPPWVNCVQNNVSTDSRSPKSTLRVVGSGKSELFCDWPNCARPAFANSRRRCHSLPCYFSSSKTSVRSKSSSPMCPCPQCLTCDKDSANYPTLCKQGELPPGSQLPRRRGRSGEAAVSTTPVVQENNSSHMVPRCASCGAWTSSYKQSCSGEIAVTTAYQPTTWYIPTGNEDTSTAAAGLSNSSSRTSSNLEISSVSQSQHFSHHVISLESEPVRELETKTTYPLNASDDPTSSYPTCASTSEEISSASARTLTARDSGIIRDLVLSTAKLSLLPRHSRCDRRNGSSTSGAAPRSSIRRSNATNGDLGFHFGVGKHGKDSVDYCRLGPKRHSSGSSPISTPPSEDSGSENVTVTTASVCLEDCQKAFDRDAYGDLSMCLPHPSTSHARNTSTILDVPASNSDVGCSQFRNSGSLRESERLSVSNTGDFTAGNSSSIQEKCFSGSHVSAEIEEVSKVGNLPSSERRTEQRTVHPKVRWTEKASSYSSRDSATRCMIHTDCCTNPGTLGLSNCEGAATNACSTTESQVLSDLAHRGPVSPIPNIAHNLSEKGVSETSSPGAAASVNSQPQNICHLHPNPEVLCGENRQMVTELANGDTSVTVQSHSACIPSPISQSAVQPPLLTPICSPSAVRFDGCLIPSPSNAWLPSSAAYPLFSPAFYPSPCVLPPPSDMFSTGPSRPHLCPMNYQSYTAVCHAYPAVSAPVLPDNKVDTETGDEKTITESHPGEDPEKNGDGIPGKESAEDEDETASVVSHVSRRSVPPTVKTQSACNWNSAPAVVNHPGLVTPFIIYPSGQIDLFRTGTVPFELPNQQQLQVITVAPSTPTHTSSGIQVMPVLTETREFNHASNSKPSDPVLPTHSDDANGALSGTDTLGPSNKNSTQSQKNAQKFEKTDLVSKLRVDLDQSQFPPLVAHSSSSSTNGVVSTTSSAQAALTDTVSTEPGRRAVEVSSAVSRLTAATPCQRFPFRSDLPSFMSTSVPPRPTTSFQPRCRPPPSVFNSSFGARAPLHPQLPSGFFYNQVNQNGVGFSFVSPSSILSYPASANAPVQPPVQLNFQHPPPPYGLLSGNQTSGSSSAGPNETNPVGSTASSISATNITPGPQISVPVTGNNQFASGSSFPVIPTSNAGLNSTFTAATPLAFPASPFIPNLFIQQPPGLHPSNYSFTQLGNQYPNFPMPFWSSFATGPRPVSCYACGQLGHKANQCPSRMPNQQIPENTFNLSCAPAK